MKMIRTIAAGAMAIVLCSCADNRNIENASYQVIPMIKSIDYNEQSQDFVLNTKTVIRYSPETEEMQRNAAFLQSYIEEINGTHLNIKPGVSDNADNEIALQLAAGEGNSEAYQIVSNSSSIKVTATGASGIFYGIQTLRKSLPVINDVRVAFKAATIQDEPRFSYRGMHLDCCRHFFPLDSVKTYIDMLALHNCNVFHWHLTDDQGWRLEIKKYPGITEIGSVRKGTMIKKDWESNDSIPVGGFYTQEEAREIVRYAAERHIEVIPEIEMPGHMLGALAAYPQLGCTGGPYEVWCRWGISDDVLCLGNPDVVNFCKDILDEVMDIFPSKYVHIGGDECPKVRWEKCPKCQAKIKELGLNKRTGKKEYSGWEGYKEYTPEQRLQSWFTRQIDDYLTAKGKVAIGWDEILEGGISDNAVVMSWRGTEGGVEAARLHHQVIMVPNGYCYFDYCQRKNTENEPLAIGGYVPLEKIYSFEPQLDELTDDEKQYIIGLQANMWCEYVKTFNHVQYMVLPRMAGLAEVQWNQPNTKDYEAFKKRLDHMMDLYRHYGWRVSLQYIEEPAASVE